MAFEWANEAQEGLAWEEVPDLGPGWGNSPHPHWVCMHGVVVERWRSVGS